MHTGGQVDENLADIKPGPLLTAQLYHVATKTWPTTAHNLGHHLSLRRILSIPPMQGSWPGTKITYLFVKQRRKRRCLAALDPQAPQDMVACRSAIETLYLPHAPTPTFYAVAGNVLDRAALLRTLHVTST